jgi:hypothetical protein
VGYCHGPKEIADDKLGRGSRMNCKVAKMARNLVFLESSRSHQPSLVTICIKLQQLANETKKPLCLRWTTGKAIFGDGVGFSTDQHKHLPGKIKRLKAQISKSYYDPYQTISKVLI